MYQWIRRYRVPEAERLVSEDQNAELRRLKAELRRVTEERDILKKAAAYFAKTSE
jgi:transposase